MAVTGLADCRWKAMKGLTLRKLHAYCKYRTLYPKESYPMNGHKVMVKILRDDDCGVVVLYGGCVVIDNEVDLAVVVDNPVYGISVAGGAKQNPHDRAQ